MLVTKFCRRIGKNGKFQAAQCNTGLLQEAKQKFFVVFDPTLTHNFCNIFKKSEQRSLVFSSNFLQNPLP